MPKAISGVACPRCAVKAGWVRPPAEKNRMFYGMGLFISVASAVACYRWADTPHNNPVVWALIGFFFPCIGLLACVILVKR